MNDSNQDPVKEDENENLDQSHLASLVFDEMNLIEIPFCLLTNSSKGIDRLVLSPEGDRYLKTTDEGGLPTAIARRVVMGLLWMTKERSGFKDRVVRFKLRDLVENFAFPSKYKSYRANDGMMKAVKEQIHRIANTRLCSDRWWNKTKQEHVKINASIIDYVEEMPLKPGHARIMEIAWGTAVFQSVQSQYTKDFDLTTWMQIGHPLDEALFRWLHRQLHGKKAKQSIKSCQRFARFKLGMTGMVVEKGGRTSSSYIVKKLRKSLERMNNLGFPVKMTIDSSQADFSLCFEKMKKGKQNEALDPISELLFEFKKVFHKASSLGRINDKERAVAASWIETYGLKKGLWMISHCHKLHKESPYRNQPRYTLGSLKFYESAASGAFDQAKKGKNKRIQIKLIEVRQKQWEHYQQAMHQLASKQFSEAALLEEAKRQVKQDPAASKHILDNPEISSKIKEGFLMSKARIIKLKKVGAFTQDEFESFQDETALIEALIERHQFNPLLEG